MEVLAGFKAKTLTPSDYLDACLDQISLINPRINALTTINSSRAVTAAREATKRWQAGSPIGPLDGVPIGVKDLQNTRDLLTTHGSPRLRAYLPDDDLPLVARLRRAGAIVLAKTNVPECGAGGNTRNPVWGATGNPFDANLVCGGSSGGSAAALAANLLPLCTGSDTGGSLRLPAAFCGVVGFRPSVDVVAHPTRPLGWSGISVLGPMTRTVDDLILAMQLCQAADPDDPLSVPAKADRFTALPDIELGDLRVGVSEDFGGAPVDPAIRDTFRNRIETISRKVRNIFPVDLDLGDMDRCFDVLRAESFTAAFGEIIKSEPDAFGDEVSENIKLGQSMSLADRAWAHAEQTRILRRFNALMRDVDVILLPTTPVSPFPWTQRHPAEIDGQKLDIYYRWLSLTYRGSLPGGPSITLPCGRDPFGLPFGLQVLGPVGGDAKVLAVAKALEAAFEQDRETARARPDLNAIPLSKVSLQSIVTHPPQMDAKTGAEKSTLGTAV
ncbi:amidase [Pelagimonas phthalicica]|uniref:amidase n=1 Tax=Pelagimonas phthalicica TaxID=1037362 RepID=UPI001F337CDF|nr:amidase [Pelagimonas phthalicica]